MEQTNLLGSTGLLRTSFAGSGAPGTFRVSFLADWFTATGFLCKDFKNNPSATTKDGVPITCGAQNNPDHTSRVGATFALNVTPLSFLEAYALIRTYATSNDQGSPQLLQVLGDTTFGVKAFVPNSLGRWWNVGGEIQLLLLNGTGGVGVSGGGTSALFRGLASADLRKPQDAGVPLRFNLNLGYKIDNSGKLVADVEQRRADAVGLSHPQPITRIERFGLGINRVDTFQIGLGAEAPFSRVQPYLEWSADIPANRQGYTCHTGSVSKGDVCLGLDMLTSPTPRTEGGPGFKAFPSRFTIGVKTNPLPKTFHGLSAHAAIDIGTSGTSTFIEELAPQAPWTLYLGLGFAYDTREKEVPPPPPPPPAPPPQILPAPQTFVRGFVHEQGRTDAGVPDAIITFEGGAQSPVATGPDGKFVTRHLDPGTYKLAIKAPGFKPGVCEAVVNPPGAAPGAPGAVPPGAPGAVPPGAPGAAPPGAPGVPGAAPSPFGAPPPSPFGAPAPSPFGAPPPAPGTPGAPTNPGNVFPPAATPPAPQGPTFVDIDCPIESLPKTGGIVGVVRDAESNAPIAGAVIKLIDANGKETSATADGTGSFSFKDLGPGAVMLRGEANGYLSHVSPAEIRASEDSRPILQLTKRPKVASVKVEGKEIRISKQIHFETDSAKILGDSNSLLEEIADVMQHNLGIRKVEIQGHTDNTGTREHNLQLSDARAASVKAWLVGAGVDANRMVAKGYGQDRPLAPNVTAVNKARNRRVQFIILEGK